MEMVGEDDEGGGFVRVEVVCLLHCFIASLLLLGMFHRVGKGGDIGPFWGARWVFWVNVFFMGWWD
ncbi:MAG: hypothetical protein WAW86_02290 [Gammaproteobacteria bacterium]